MTHGYRSRLRKALPEQLSASLRFLLWKKTYSPKRKKWVKKPFYASGLPRGGVEDDRIELESPRDLALLVSLEDALVALEASADGSGRAFDGVGIALTGDGVGAFDIDHCLTPEGDLLPDHPGVGLVQSAEARGAYIEVSPSGTGLHIFGVSEALPAYSKEGVEYWSRGRYLTVTGSTWANPKGWAGISDLREALGTMRAEPTGEPDDSFVTPKILKELRSALDAMGSDERDLWIRIGHALKQLGDKGLELWLQWSAKSEKFNEADARSVWDGFKPTRTGYKAVFAEAQANWGWENPRKKRRDRGDDDDDPPPPDEEDEAPAKSILDYSLDLGAQELLPTEFVLDGFLPVGVTLVAGAWGAGKSTNLIPLFASVAHLTPAEWELHPQIRRHVIWVTEAPDQARDTLYSISKAEGSRSWSEFKSWFHVVPSRRQDPKRLAKELAKAVPVLTRRVDPNGPETPQNLAVDAGYGPGPGETTREPNRASTGVFWAQPVIVLDTTSANLDLENESDNSEVGAAMAALKEALVGVPLVLVGHTPKALVKSDISDMTFRGAGAWEADAVATYYLVHDQDTGLRFMAVRKARFTPDYTEVSFGQAGGRELIPTPWGEPQSKAYVHGVPCRSNGDERKAAQQAAKEEKQAEEKEKVLTTRQSAIIEAVARGAAAFSPYTRTALREFIGGKTQLVHEATMRLLEAGKLVVAQVPEEYRGHFPRAIQRQTPEILLPEGSDVQAFWQGFKGHWEA